jgi:hypothetical protein
MLKEDIILSLLIILMGTLDCVTTVIGVLYSGAVELNPFMAGIVNTNISAFLVVKIGGTIFIALTYILARQVLMRMPNKSGKAFNYSSKLLRFTYAGLVSFLSIVVANNLLILIR